MIALADTLRRDGYVIAQREMNDAAFVRRHRFERDRLLVCLDALTHAFREFAQHALAARAIALDIYRQFHRLIRAMRDEKACDKFQVVKRFAAPTDQYSEIVPDNIQDDRVRIVR